MHIPGLYDVDRIRWGRAGVVVENYRIGYTFRDNFIGLELVLTLIDFKCKKSGTTGDTAKMVSIDKTASISQGFFSQNLRFSGISSSVFGATSACSRF
nr:hypothetical protein [Haliscomenobacter sp.]